MRLLTIFIFFILFQSCSSENTKEIILENERFIKIVNHLTDTMQIDEKGDTVFILHGLYKVNTPDSSRFIKANFDWGYLDGNVIIKDFYGEYQGEYLPQDFEEFYSNYHENVTLFIDGFDPLRGSLNIDSKFIGKSGVPDGIHKITKDDQVVMEFKFDKGVPIGIWKDKSGGNWTEFVEFDNGNLVKRSNYSDTTLRESQQYKDNEVALYEAFNNDGTIKTQITYDNNEKLIERRFIYNNGGQLEYESYVDHSSNKQYKKMYSKGILVKKIEGDREYIYENGQEVGVIVKVQFNLRDEGVLIDVPSGKIWTPLYHEAKVNCRNISYYSTPRIYPKMNRFGGYIDRFSYPFPSKKEFHSIKESVRNNKAITGNKEAVWGTVLGCNNIDFTLFFLEENS